MNVQVAQTAIPWSHEYSLRGNKQKSRYNFNSCSGLCTLVGPARFELATNGLKVRTLNLLLGRMVEPFCAVGCLIRCQSARVSLPIRIRHCHLYMRRAFLWPSLVTIGRLLLSTGHNCSHACNDPPLPHRGHFKRRHPDSAMWRAWAIRTDQSEAAGHRRP